MRKWLLSLIGIVLALFVGSSAVLAGYSNTIRLAIGARQAGMGGAHRAIADDGTAPEHRRLVG